MHLLIPGWEALKSSVYVVWVYCNPYYEGYQLVLLYAMQLAMRYS